MSFFTDKQNAAPCPCGSGLTLGQCCGKFIDLDATPQKAVEVMRARYTAFALGHEDWLRATWAANKRPRKKIIDPQYKWLGLKMGGSGAVRHHEVSRFERRQDLWYYVDGDVLDK